jgi:hypothetical protein
MRFDAIRCDSMRFDAIRCDASFIQQILTAQPEIYSTIDGADADDNYDNSSQELLSTNGIISHDAEESIETNQVV